MSESREPPRLATGWEPDTPVGDTMLRRFVFALAGAWEPAIAAMGGRVQRSAEFAVTDLGRPAGYGNSVTLLRPLPPVTRSGWPPSCPPSKRPSPPARAASSWSAPGQRPT